MHRLPSRRSARRGFTLIELLIVLLILAGIMALALPEIFKRMAEAQRRTARNQILAFEKGLQDYKVDNNAYPTTQQGLQALLAPPMAAGGMATGAVPVAGPNSTGIGGMVPVAGPNAGGVDPMTGMPTGGGLGAGMGAIDPMTGMPTGGGAMGAVDPMTGMPMGMGGGTGAIDPMTGMPVANGAMGTGGMAPTTMPTMGAAAGAKNWNGPYMSNITEIPLDPWDNPYQYMYPAPFMLTNKPAIWSLGPDGQPNTGDEIMNWDPNKVNTQGAQQALSGQMTNGMMQPGAMPQGMNPMDPMGGMGQPGMDPMNPMDPMGGMGQPGMNPMNPMDPMGGMGAPNGMNPMDPMGGMPPMP